jgi:hypothetical protein
MVKNSKPSSESLFLFTKSAKLSKNRTWRRTSQRRTKSTGMRTHLGLLLLVSTSLLEKTCCPLTKMIPNKYNHRWVRWVTQQTSITICLLSIKENQTFSVSVYSKQMEVCHFRFLLATNKWKLLFSVSSVFHIYIQKA